MIDYCQDCGCPLLGGQCLAFNHNEVAALRKRFADTETEKARRIYYQSIVYSVCCVLDQILQRATVSGTVEHPSNDVQESMLRLQDRLTEAEAKMDKKYTRETVDTFIYEADELRKRLVAAEARVWAWQEMGDTIMRAVCNSFGPLSDSDVIGAFEALRAENAELRSKLEGGSL